MLYFLGHLPLVALVAKADALIAERAETCGMPRPQPTRVIKLDGIVIAADGDMVASEETAELAVAALVASLQVEAEERRVRLATSLSMDEWEMRENPPPCPHCASDEEIAQWRQEYMNVHRALYETLEDVRRANFN